MAAFILITPNSGKEQTDRHTERQTDIKFIINNSIEALPTTKRNYACVRRSHCICICLRHSLSVFCVCVFVCVSVYVYVCAGALGSSNIRDVQSNSESDN